MLWNKSCACYICKLRNIDQNKGWYLSSFILDVHYFTILPHDLIIMFQQVNFTHWTFCSLFRKLLFTEDANCVSYFIKAFCILISYQLSEMLSYSCGHYVCIFTHVSRKLTIRQIRISRKSGISRKIRILRNISYSPSPISNLCNSKKVKCYC